MTPDIAATLAVIGVALVLFASERLRVDVVALCVLIVVAALRLVSVDEIFAGFANPAVITVWAVYMVSGAMFVTGVADVFGRTIVRLAGMSEQRLMVVIMATCGSMSAFINNVGATAMLLPAVVGISRQTRIPASKLLIPLSFSSLLGGSMTLVGTPANILAAGILTERGLRSFGFFDFTPIGAVLLVSGVAFIATVGRSLLPVRESPDERKEDYRAREYVTEFRVSSTSPIAGSTLLQSRLGADFDLNVVAMIRQGQVRTDLSRDTLVEPGDLLLVEGSADKVLRARDELGLQMEPDQADNWERIDDSESHVVEATLAPRSRMVGRSLRDMRFRDRYGFSALAVWRHGEAITQRLRDVKLEFGDALLLRGPRRRLPALREGDEFLVLEPVVIDERRTERALLAVGILALVLVMVVFFGVHISLAMVGGALLLVLTGCLTMDEAYESVDWRTVFLVACMLPLGMAMEETGTAKYIAELMLGVLGEHGPMAAMAGVYLLGALITQPMSNAAAVVLVVPIAIDAAAGMEVSHLAFTMAAVIGAATSFLSPVGHKANVLVFGPGGYRFFDYARVGLPLTIILFIVSMIFIPIFFPL